MKNHCIVRVVFVWVLCLLAERGSAQEADHTTWVKVGVKHEVLPKLALSGNLEWRTEDDLSRTDRWGLDVGGSYKLLPFLKVGAGYEVHYRNLEEDIELTVDVRSFEGYKPQEQIVLACDDLKAENSAAGEKVAPVQKPCGKAEDGFLTTVLGKASWNVIRLVRS